VPSALFVVAVLLTQLTIRYEASIARLFVDRNQLLFTGKQNSESCLLLIAAVAATITGRNK
jgi:hypothetical protein